MIDFRDRMDGLVAANHKGRLDDLEHEDAVQRALVKFSENLIGTFRGTSMGELVNATKRLCHWVCIDVVDDAKTYREKHWSLDEGWDAAADPERPSPAWEADAAHAALTEAESAANADAFMAWALPQLVESRRAVVERTFAGAPLEEIREELGLSRDNAYQLRSRGLKDLAKLHQRYET